MNMETTVPAQDQTYAHLKRSISARVVRLRRDKPAVMKGFGDLASSAMADGALSAKTKELMALALGIAAHCDACIAFHAKTLVDLEATEREVEEALAVAVYMGGGPSLMFGARTMDAFNEFSELARGERAA